MSNNTIDNQPASNRLLASLPPAEQDRLLSLMEPVALELKQVLYEPNQPITHVYFPLTSVISLLVLMEDGGIVEVGIVGNEGMVGLPVFLGATSTAGQAIIQIPGDALSMRRELFVEAVLEGDGPLYRALHRYTQALFIQATQGSACNRLHTLEQRFCRWALMTHDRVGRDSFPFAQEFIRQMLGDAQANASDLTAKFELAGLIGYQSGTITIRDRPGLEAASCECYRVIRAEFDRVAAYSNPA